MSAAGREATTDYSRGGAPRPDDPPAVRALRAGLFLLALGGVAGLVVATFSTIVQLKIGTTSSLAGHKTTFSGIDRHSIALLLIAAVALPLAYGSLRRARPAMLGLALCGIATLIVAIAVDLPDLSATGTLGLQYDQASAGAGTGYYAETLGGVLLLVAGGGLLMLASGSRR